jgi:hypothetical protein
MKWRCRGSLGSSTFPKPPLCCRQRVRIARPACESFRRRDRHIPVPLGKVENGRLANYPHDTSLQNVNSGQGARSLLETERLLETTFSGERIDALCESCLKFLVRHLVAFGAEYVPSGGDSSPGLIRLSHPDPVPTRPRVSGFEGWSGTNHSYFCQRTCAASSGTDAPGW